MKGYVNIYVRDVVGRVEIMVSLSILFGRERLRRVRMVRTRMRARRMIMVKLETGETLRW